MGIVSTLSTDTNITQEYLSFDNVNGVNSPYGTFSQYAKINPYFTFNDNEGNLVRKFETGSWWLNIPNPLYNTTLNTKDENSYSQFINNFSLDWNITPELRLRANLSVDQKKDESIIFKPAEHTDFLNYSIPNYHLRGLYQSGEGKSFSYDGKVMLNYYTNIGAHMVNAGIALNMQEINGEDYSFSIQGFPTEKLDFLIFGLQYPEGSKPVGSDNRSRLIGLWEVSIIHIIPDIFSIFRTEQMLRQNLELMTGGLLSGQSAWDGIFITNLFSRVQKSLTSSG